MFKKYFLFLLWLSISSFLFFITGCAKDPVPVIQPQDTVVVIPPVIPPVIDTISYVERIEEYYAQSNPPVTRKSVTYSFYYDTNNRVVRVGLKEYDGVRFDTATTVLHYNGNDKKPYKIITPNMWRSSISTPVYYDTTFFTYNTEGQIVKDSSLYPYYDYYASTFVKLPLVRNYYYPDPKQKIIHWMAVRSVGGELENIRRDTIEDQQTGLIKHFRAQLFLTHTIRENYAHGQMFEYSSYINPLSQLNISGTIFSLIYSGYAVQEVLGNNAHKAVRNSNILPYYLDFYSSKIPSSFYLGGFSAGGFLISHMYDRFTIKITPWSKRTSYPAEIAVGASTALEDQFVYKYFYR